MTPQSICALKPGPDLDRLVHEHVFAKTGRRKPWSTTNAALEIVEALPVAVGRRNPNDPGYSEDRPYWGGIVEQIDDETEGPHYSTTIRVFCPTAAIAICKIGLIEVFARKAKAASA